MTATTHDLAPTLSTEQWVALEKKAAELRDLTLSTSMWAGSGHIGGALSAMDAFTVLYYAVMNWSAEDMTNPQRDRFVLSKGHVGVGYAPLLADKGAIPMEWLEQFNHTGSQLGMHLDAAKVPGVEASTGSLGHGLGIALGMTIAQRVTGYSYTVYCLLGDGELNEGSVWEAAMAASHFKADSLVAFVDRNRAMIDGPTETVMSIEPLADKWRAFGWDVHEIDGHDIPTIYATTVAARNAKNGKPQMIILDTVKGEGIDFIAGDYRWHYGSFDGEMADRARAALADYAQRRLAKIGEGN